MIAAPDRGLDPQAPPGDRPGFLLYAALLIGSVLAVLVYGVVDDQWDRIDWLAVVAWCGFCALTNAMPVPAVRNISLSMGAPVNVGIALLFPPGVAAAIVVVSSVSVWELKRDTTFLHALFNRAQLAASAALAALVFDVDHSGEHVVRPVWLLLIGGVVAYQAANWALVALAEWTARGIPPPLVLRTLLPADLAPTATYLGLGLMGIPLALASDLFGEWTVILLMIPLLGAFHVLKITDQLERAERERRSLADRLIDERERERVRIASDIHDVVLQQLAALQLQADNVGAALEHNRPDMAMHLAGGLRQGVDGAIGELRGTIASLRRFSMDAGGLEPSLALVSRNFRATTGIDVVLEAEGLGEVPLPVGLLLLECCQEALTNVARHAEATRVDVRAARRGGMVELQVRDDGVGFVSDGTSSGSGLPLTGDKVRLSGGLFSLHSRPHEGTTVTVQVPLGAMA